MMRTQRLLFGHSLLKIGRRMASTTLKAMKPPLEGVVVLDLTTALAGPYATMYLADLGADVIKVESPQKGDDTRHWPPFFPHEKGSPPNGSLTRESSFFTAFNRNKRSVTINLKTPEGVALVKLLADKADVLIENMITGKLEELGMGYNKLKKTNPGLVYCSITGYGQSGPYAKAPGYDVVISGESGATHCTGEPDRPPVRPNVAVADHTAGWNAFGAVMAGLYSKQKTGEGVYIDVSMFDCSVAALGHTGSAWLMGNVEYVRQGTGLPTAVPYQMMSTKDGYLTLGVGNDPQFQKFASAIGHPDFAKDPRFITNVDRVKHRGVLIPLLASILETETTAHWISRLSNQGFPVGAVNNMEQTFQHAQVESRQLVSELSHPNIGKIKMVSPPVVYNGERMKIRKLPPGLGQDTNTVLMSNLGLSEAEVDDLRSKGVI